jgi:hypothetical protein
MGLILNVSLFDGMQFKLTGERTIIFGAVDPHQQKVVTYAIKVLFHKRLIIYELMNIKV